MSRLRTVNAKRPKKKKPPRRTGWKRKEGLEREASMPPPKSGLLFIENIWMRAYMGPTNKHKVQDINVKRIITRYHNQRTSAYNPNNRKYEGIGALGIEVKYTCREFVTWYLHWQEKLNLKRPTVARISYYEHFEFGNIKLCELEEELRDTQRRNRDTPPACGYYMILGEKVPAWMGPLDPVALKEISPWHYRGYSSWAGQCKRCENPNAINYARYGARGIKVCYGSREFLSWWLHEISKGDFKDPTIGRILHAEDYCFENVRIEESSDNGSEVVHRYGKMGIGLGYAGVPVPVDVYDGDIKISSHNSINQAAKAYGLPRNNVGSLVRSNRGYSTQVNLFFRRKGEKPSGKPPNPKKEVIIYKGGNEVSRAESVTAAAKKIGAKPEHVRRVCLGVAKTVKGHVTQYADSPVTFVPKRSNRRYVDAFYKDTGKFLKTYDSMIEAARDLNVSPSCVSAICRGREHSAKGYFFKYSDKKEDS